MEIKASLAPFIGNVAIIVRRVITLIEALQASPYRDIEIEAERAAMPVRDVSL